MNVRFQWGRNDKALHWKHQISVSVHSLIHTDIRSIVRCFRLRHWNGGEIRNSLRWVSWIAYKANHASYVTISESTNNERVSVCIRLRVQCDSQCVNIFHSQSKRRGIHFVSSFREEKVNIFLLGPKKIYRCFMFGVILLNKCNEHRTSSFMKWAKIRERFIQKSNQNEIEALPLTVSFVIFLELAFSCEIIKQVNEIDFI